MALETRPFKCPVCEGKGVVKAMFYPDLPVTQPGFVKCRSCEGKGFIYGTVITPDPPVTVTPWPPSQPTLPWGTHIRTTDSTSEVPLVKKGLPDYVGGENPKVEFLTQD